MDHTTDAPTTSSKTHRPAPMNFKKRPLIALVAFIIVAGGGFLGGVEYQKGKGTTLSSTASNTQRGSRTGGFGGANGAARSGGFGTVSAISSTSISITDRRSSSTKTYRITSATTITDNGSTVSSSDIQTGDRVMIQTSSSTSTTATAISVNPTMQGGPGGSGNGTSTSSSSSDTSTTTQTN